MAKDRRGRHRLRQQLLQRIGAGFEVIFNESDVVRIGVDSGAVKGVKISLEGLRAHRVIFRNFYGVVGVMSPPAAVNAGLSGGAW
ncbi:hypothetical protein I8Q49_20415 [Acinetobacter baumannii]|nr:hypothetical protein [Acinetobacter baumannii]